jgi:excisionase family DNA binding protein
VTQRIHLISEKTLAFSPRAVAKNCFDPPLGKEKVYDAIRSGILPTHMVGSKIYVTRDDVVNWINRSLPVRRPYRARKLKVQPNAEPVS